MPEPTQEMIDRGEVRQALSLIKAFPYPGGEAAKLEFDADDLEDLIYASTWLAHCVVACGGAKEVVNG